LEDDELPITELKISARLLGHVMSVAAQQVRGQRPPLTTDQYWEHIASAAIERINADLAQNADPRD
jgi:hypothetical protein